MEKCLGVSDWTLRDLVRLPCAKSLHLWSILGRCLVLEKRRYPFQGFSGKEKQTTSFHPFSWKGWKLGGLPRQKKPKKNENETTK